MFPTEPEAESAAEQQSPATSPPGSSRADRSGALARHALAGAALGACAAACTTFSDYGAHWLWLSSTGDRLRLLQTMITLQVPAGALLGALVGALLGWTGPTARRVAQRLLPPAHADRGARALQLTVLAAPGLLSVAVLLFSGGKMSRLPAVPLLATATALCLLLSLAAGLFALLTLQERARARGRQRWLGGALLAAGFALGKIDQTVMPGLYPYLHAALGSGALGCYALALHVLRPRGLRMPRRALLVLIASLMIASGTLALAVTHLDGNQNVRVALLHPNVSTTRSMMLALGPAVLEPLQRRAIAAERQRLREHRARQRQAADALPRLSSAIRLAASDGPRFEDAHILLITIDALRPDHLGSHGYARPTSPALDALAAESVLFERAYAPAPHSSFSLCSLMTSEYLHETLDLGHPPPRETLASALGAVGYHTAAFFTLGVFHTAGDRLRVYEQNALGFALHDHVAYEAEALTDRVLSEVDRTISRGEPSTLLWAHFFDVHEPYQDTRFGTSDLDRYDGEIQKVDTAIDRLIRQTRERLTRELIIVVSADHGEEFREHGGVYHGSSLYEEQIRVPLIIHVPGIAPRRISAPVETLAVAPTLLGLTGVALPRTMRGDDLRPVLEGHDVQLRPAFAAVIHKKMVVRWPHKLIADLRFGLYELFDLERDPHERVNLAGTETALRDALREDIYGWLDSLAPEEHDAPSAPVDPRTAALSLGRLGDRRAVEPLLSLANDVQASQPERRAALQMLGHLADPSTAAALFALLGDETQAVADEAAIALGRMFDPRARSALRRIVHSEDPSVRTRAAVSLGRLRDRAAVPALIEALWIAPDAYEREEAVRWLGRLGDTQALDPLLQILPESRTRHLALVAIGRLGDARAYDVLLDALRRERLSDVRSAAAQALGYLGDTRAIEPLITLAATGGLELAASSESLVRLSALRRGAIGGADAVRDSQPGGPLRGFGACHATDPWHDWDFLHRTYCTTSAQASTLQLVTPAKVAAEATLLVLSARRSDVATPVLVRLTLGRTPPHTLTIDGTFREHRIELPPAALPAGRVLATLETDDPAARLDVNHLLILPRFAPPDAGAP